MDTQTCTYKDTHTHLYTINQEIFTGKKSFAGCLGGENLMSENFSTVYTSMYNNILYSRNLSGVKTFTNLVVSKQFAKVLTTKLFIESGSVIINGCVIFSTTATA